MKNKLLSVALFCALGAVSASGVEIETKNGYYEFGGIDASGFSITQKPVLKCSPKISGTYESINENTFRFYPRPKLSAGVSYSCQAGKQSFEFETESFANTELRLLRPGLILVSFNDAVSKDSLQKASRMFRVINLAKNDITYEITSHDDRNFLFAFDPKAQNVTLQISDLSSKAGAKLEDDIVINTDEEPFNDNINASNLSGVQIRAVSLKNGSLAGRICFPSYMDGISAKYVRIEGINKFSLTQPRYYYYDEDEEDLDEFLDEFLDE